MSTKVIEKTQGIGAHIGPAEFTTLTHIPTQPSRGSWQSCITLFIVLTGTRIIACCKIARKIS